MKPATSSRRISMVILATALSHVAVLFSDEVLSSAVAATTGEAIAQSGPATKPSLAWLDLNRPDLAAVSQAANAGDEPAALRQLLDHYRNRLPKPGTASPLTASQQLAANLAIKNQMQVFGRVEPYDLGTPIAWTRNPTDNIEFIYFINRHSLVKALADAYAATGEEKYAAHAIDTMIGWIRTVPPTTKAPLRELEVALRGQAWADSMQSLVHSPAMTPATLGILLSSLSTQVQTLVPADNWAEGNHGVNTSWAMMYVGLKWPELAHSSTFATLGWERLNTHMAREVYNDGAQIELTAGYHTWCIRRFHDSLDLAVAGGLPINPAYAAKLEKMYDYVLALLKPDATMPTLGDAEMRNGVEVMTRGAAHFRRPDMLYLATAGQQGSPPTQLDFALEDAGYYAMRSSWTDPKAVYAMLDVAHKWGGWHSHFDSLELHLYGFGRNLLPESGTISYAAGPRAKSRATRSKSTVTIDGKDQSEVAATTHAFISTPDIAFVDGSHNGYPGINHRRQVLFVRGKSNPARPYLLLIDRITGNDSHTVQQFFHLPPGEAISENAGVRTAFETGGNLQVRSLSPQGIHPTVASSWITLSGGSSQSGVESPRKAAVTTYTGPLPVTLVTLLLPYEGPTPPDLQSDITASTSPGAGSHKVQISSQQAGWTDTIVLGESAEIRRTSGTRVDFNVSLAPVKATTASAGASSVAPSRASSRPADPSLLQVQDVPGLPRVLLIGDSISMGYTLPVRAKLTGKANVHRPPTNCANSQRGLDQLDRWLGDGKWDVIHFNFGLHDLKYIDKDGKFVRPQAGTVVATPDAYEANLRRLVARLKQTNARLIFATTTPVPPETPGRVEGSERLYNERAIKVMAETGVDIDDLWSFVTDVQSFLRPLPRKPEQGTPTTRPGDVQLPYNVHFTPEGYDRLAAKVVASIEAALAKPSK